MFSSIGIPEIVAGVILGIATVGFWLFWRGGGRESCRPQGGFAVGFREELTAPRAVSHYRQDRFFAFVSQADEAWDREMAREKAGDCPNARTQ